MAPLPRTAPTLGSFAELHRRSTSSAPQFGSGAKPASEFNNKGFLALFALIGAGMVLGSIWFFFWAKNGGFRWRGKDDWDDYKSTVLRRKGPDGRTLSNATKSTKLGGGSVVHGGTYGAPTSVGYSDTTSSVDEKDQVRAGEGIRGGGGRRHKRRKGNDPELAEYRHEKAARVGGINRASDGAYFDYSNTEPSEISERPLVAESPNNKKKAKKEAEQREKERKHAAKEAAKREKEEAAKEKKREKALAKEKKKDKGRKERSRSPVKAEPERVQTPPRRSAPSNAYSFTQGDDRTETATSYTGGYTATEIYSDAYTNPSNQDSYYSSYRPHASTNLPRPPPAARSYESPRHSTRDSPRHSNRDSPRHSNRDSPGRSRQSSPRKHHRSSHSHSRHQSRSRPNSHSDLSSDTGTKAYPCHIPGLSAPTVVPEESISQVGMNRPRRGRDVMDGYRRSRARGRRDSLSDSDNDY
ncbi:uncharacterized protein K452DRAFT_300618 [Aplosporella prunicola CBS 121167]|uniref:Uncharacterized protein n=1 Tax=Aplosporella prunicola CBS 121167 TaxID=1176127 RepID=A0A6A6B731_9PEZI|nr:uncharacterized protein K452DRAFT_300618 [Aplosporella prunicola CBS 121167]KAF2139044.1 hypothetical protein K452DRAFT_300618 [Aplosporella prunicola CBS 121167]